MNTSVLNSVPLNSGALYNGNRPSYKRPTRWRANPAAEDELRTYNDSATTYNDSSRTYSGVRDDDNIIAQKQPTEWNS